ncbi:CD209 antigen-like protein A [Ruditapes philippinarum]|uniref:CD209 antigen-like protein A n=1 Tax=Ruditapes philippinarum TaxID=129788 RepID=UPI00295A6676|nr:CD209 antigen-like protein A [Ruditapes philippinarum]
MWKIYFIVCIIWLYTDQIESCQDGWVSHNTRCYHFSHDEESLPVAALVCQNMGGELAEIETAEENVFLINKVKILKNYFWIGLTDIQEEGIWRWYSSKRLLTTTGFSSWAPGRPDNIGGKENCCQIRSDGLWGDDQCHVFKFYICEKPLENNEIIG